MNNKKQTKKALCMSVLSMVLCVAMLVGMTFAWFTDTASTGVNKIQAGELKVKLEYKVGDEWKDAEGQMLTFKTADNRTADKILWEPGCTYELPKLRVVNDGNLALKYKIQITGIDGDAELNKVIDWTVKSGDEDYDLTAEHHLAAMADSESADVFTIKGHMQESAGNAYQGLSIEGIAITVYATQDTVEYDSNSNQYDKSATYAVADFATLQKKFEGSGVYNVTEDIKVEDTLALTGYNALTLDATGKTISNSIDLWDADAGAYSLLSARNGSYLTVAGGNFEAKANDCYAVDVQDGATVTIKDGTFVGNIHAVYVQKGTANIEGGFYSVQQKYPDAAKANEFVLNCLDANHANGTATIIVTGGTFVNFNPADCYAEGAHTNFVAEGYKVVSETQTNGDVWYTVVKE